MPSLLRIASASRSRVAGDQRAVGAGRRLGVAKDVNPFVDLFLELVFVEKANGLHGGEEAADASRERTADQRGDCVLRLVLCFKLIA